MDSEENAPGLCWFCSKDCLFTLSRRHGHRHRAVEEGVDPRATQLTERSLARVKRVTFKGDIHDTKSPRSAGSEEKGWPVEKETLICYDTPSFVYTIVDATFPRAQLRRSWTVERLSSLRSVCLYLSLFPLSTFTPATHRPPAMKFLASLRWWALE